MKFRMFIILSLLIFIIGCGPSLVNIKILKPAEINIKSIEKIAILDFDLPQGVDKSMGSEIVSKLTSKFVQNGHFKIIERKELNRVLNEQGLAMTGAIDPTRAQEIGKLLGADALILGTLNTYTHSDASANDTIFKVYRAERVATADITFRVTDIKTGEIIASKTNRNAQKAATNRSYEDQSREEKMIGLVGGILTQKEVKNPADKARQDALASLPAQKNMLDQAVDNILNSFVAQIAPHFVVEYRPIESGDDKRMKSALAFVKRDMWDDAKNLWVEVLDNPKAQKDYAAAHYNLGMYYESVGELNKSEEEYNTAFKMKDKEEYLDAIANIRKRKKEQEQLKEQMEKK